MKNLHTFEEFLNENLNEAKSPNAEFIKLFKAAMKQFPTFEPHIYRDKVDILRKVIELQSDFNDGSYPRSYNGLSYRDRSNLSKMIPSWKLKETLTAGEQKTLQSICKPKYEDLFEKFLTDEKISEAIQEKWNLEFPEENYTDTSRFVIGIRLIKDMPDLFKFVKDKLMSDDIDFKDWQTLAVKSTLINSKHSAVASSSFSTSHHYDVEVRFMGKTFTAKDIVLGTSFYSGGWN